jgi:glycosyltransferase involved in cell wall biosynthesis
MQIPVGFVPSFKPWLPDAGVPVWKRSLFNLYQLPFLLKSAFQLKQAIKEYHVDLVHTGSATLIDGALAAKLAGIPHVWHIRETIEPNCTLTFVLGTGAARFLIKLFADRVLANSVAIAKPYILSEKDRQKVKVVYNGINLTPFNESFSRADLLHELDLPASGPIVGMVAQLVPLKRHEDFIRAAALINRIHPQVYFVCIGGNPHLSDSYILSLKKLVADLGIEDRLIWLGHQNKIHRFFQALDIVVLPSQEESFGRVLVEAMAACRPVVATVVGGIPDIVVDGQTGYLVPVHQPQSLAEAILTLLQNPQLAHSMGQTGRRRVEAYFTEAQYINSVEAIYQELL